MVGAVIESGTALGEVNTWKLPPGRPKINCPWFWEAVSLTIC